MTKEKRFLNVYGWILILFFCGCLYTLWVTSYIEDHPISHDYFVITISLWYLITGIGILARREWGYYLFKSFLYVMFLAFPIGTIISYKSLGYMKRNNIKRFFGG
jgi:hypothetical protein